MTGIPLRMFDLKEKSALSVKCRIQRGKNHPLKRDVLDMKLKYF